MNLPIGRDQRRAFARSAAKGKWRIPPPPYGCFCKYRGRAPGWSVRAPGRLVLLCWQALARKRPNKVFGRAYDPCGDVVDFAALGCNDTELCPVRENRVSSMVLWHKGNSRVR